MESANGGGVVLEQLLAQIGQLDQEDKQKQRLELLTSLKTAMGNLSRAQLAEQLGNTSIEVLFACLDSDNMEQIQSTCEILKSLMNILDPVACLDKYHESIISGFNHPVPEVPALIISHLTRCIEADETSLDKYPNLRISVINQLVSEELGAAKQADRFLMKYGTIKAGMEFFLSDGTIAAFKGLINNSSFNDSKKFRVYETLINVTTISPEHFNRVNESLGIMQLLVNLSFRSTDFLGQINALEILSTLVGCPHGQEALVNAGVFEEIKRLVNSLDGNPMGEILLPGIIKFIGKVGAVALPPVEMVTLVLNTLRKNEKDFAQQTVATEAFAYIGSTVPGKQYYKGLADIKIFFKIIRGVIMEAPTEFRSRGLQAMSILFGSDEANEDCLPHWFNVLFRDMSEVFEIVRLPFPELRISALNFLSSIAHLEWAQRHYLRGAGVIEFLISRDPEPVKECVYSKFRLVKIIVDSPSSAKILSAEQIAQLKLYIHQGPFYAHAESTVTTAGAE